MNLLKFKTFATQKLGHFNYANHSSLNSKLLIELHEIGWLRDSSSQNVKAGITRSLLNYSNKDGIKELLSYICSSLISYSANTEYCNSRNAKITDMWGVQYLTGENTDPHTHHPNTLSFVYFVSSQKNDSPLVFCDSLFKFNGKPGELLIFPSHLKHYVPKQKNKNKRTTIAGNVIYTGWTI